MIYEYLNKLKLEVKLIFLQYKPLKYMQLKINDFVIEIKFYEKWMTNSYCKIRRYIDFLNPYFNFEYIVILI